MRRSLKLPRSLLPQSERGRYKGAAWSEAALAELLADGGGGGGGGGGSSGSDIPMPNPTRSGDKDDDQVDVDNATAGGLFGWLGRDGKQQGGVHAGVHLPNRAMAAPQEVQHA